MAFTRTKLKGYGLTDEQVSAVMDDHVEVVDALKQERDEYKKASETLQEVQKELDGIKKDGWQKKYEDEHRAFEDYKKDAEGKATRAAKESAYREALVKAGVPEKRLAAVMRLSDVDGVELDDKGGLKDPAAVDKAIREEWAEMIPTTTTTGAKTSTPPAGSSAKSKEDIFKIKDPVERQRAIAENHELFGI